MKISSLTSVLMDSLWSLVTQLRAALMIPLGDSTARTSGCASELDHWLRDDPRVTMDPGNQYGTRRRGYLTSNGRGSLDIGAAED